MSERRMETERQIRTKRFGINPLRRKVRGHEVAGMSMKKDIQGNQFIKYYFTAGILGLVASRNFKSFRSPSKFFIPSTLLRGGNPKMCFHRCSLPLLTVSPGSGNPGGHYKGPLCHFLWLPKPEAPGCQVSERFSALSTSPGDLRETVLLASTHCL